MKIGIAEGNIRTPIGMQMTGYAGRVFGAMDIHDQLKMSALYIESEGVESMIIVCQVLGFDPDFSRVTEAKICQAINIPETNLILGAIHTHGGPASGTLYGCGCADPVWLEQTQQDLIDLAKKAVANSFDGYFEYASGTCEIALNRVAMSKYPNYMDMIDKETAVVKFYETATGQLKAVFLNYGCHPVVLNHKNHLYTADYVYYAIKKLQEAYGEDVAVIFSTGCCGDLNPRYRFTFEMAEKTGNLLADSVVSAKKIFTNRQAQIKCHAKQLVIPLVIDYTYDDLAEFKKKALAEVERLTEQNYNENFIMIQVEAVKALWAELCMKGFESGDLKTTIYPMIKVLQIGDLSFIALPFEVFHELGLKIKGLFNRAGRSIVMGYSNGVYGYLPYGELYEKASYEAKTAFRYYGYPGPVCKEAGDIIYKYLEEIVDTN
ncbi:MAG: hypothetical protein ACOX3Q_13775 [Clostridia bacterium]|jgi:neutral ceramidase